MVQETPVGIHAMRLEGSTDTVLIVWTDQARGHRTVEYTNHDLISATGLMGGPVQSKDTPSGEARLNLDSAEGPIYLTWSAPRPH
jgi:hypothetical protein